MDGIPVKINEKYKPPRKLALPACVMNRLNNVSFAKCTYDFYMENMVAQHMVKLNRISHEEIDKHEANVSPEMSPDKPNTYENGGNSNEPTILTPVPISSSQVVTISTKDNSFKYSDFENDTSSPFDNEELKTLNDMEELAHVLGATSVGIQNQQMRESCTDVTNIGGNDQWQINYGSPSQRQFYGNSYTPVSASTSHPSLGCPNSSQMRMTGLHDSYHVTNYQAYNARNTIQHHDDDKPGFNYVQDVLAQANQNDEEVSKIFKSLQDCLGHRKTERHHESTTPNQPDATECGQYFGKLNDQEQAMARRVGEMGFPLSRTSAAVRLFGLDESKIIEYLLLVQTYVDKGYSESQIVLALEANQCDETLTTNYLERLSQIMRLGFKEDEVVTALAKSQNDMDKALDILIR